MNKNMYFISFLFVSSFGCSIDSTNTIIESSFQSPLPSVSPPIQPNNYPTPTPLPTRYRDGFNGIYNISESEGLSRGIINVFNFDDGSFSIISSDNYSLYLNSFNKYGVKEINDLLIYIKDKDSMGDSYYYSAGKNGNIVLAILEKTNNKYKLLIKNFEGSVNKSTFEIPLNDMNVSDVSLDIDNDQNIAITYITNKEYQNSLIINKYDKTGKIIFSNNELLQSRGENYHTSIVKIDINQNIIVLWDDLISLSAKIFDSKGNILNYKKNLINGLSVNGSGSTPLYNFIPDKEGNIIITWNSDYKSDIEYYLASYIQKFDKSLKPYTNKILLTKKMSDNIWYKTPYISEDNNGNLSIYDTRPNKEVFLDKNLNTIEFNNKFSEILKYPPLTGNKIINIQPDGNFIMVYTDVTPGIYYKRFNKEGNIVINK